MSDTSKDSEVRLGKSANSIVDGLGAVDSKVDAMTRALKNDPDTLGDKIFKAAVPALTGWLPARYFRPCGIREPRAGIPAVPRTMPSKGC